MDTTPLIYTNSTTTAPSCLARARMRNWPSRAAYAEDAVAATAARRIRRVRAGNGRVHDLPLSAHARLRGGNRRSPQSRSQHGYAHASLSVPLRGVTERLSALSTADVRVPVLLGLWHHPRPSAKADDAPDKDDPRMSIASCGADARMSVRRRLEMAVCRRPRAATSDPLRTRGQASPHSQLLGYIGHPCFVGSRQHDRDRHTGLW
ncbi:hypothetical protein OKW42_004718 [Paraburkholderia sp. WC7.3d]